MQLERSREEAAKLENAWTADNVVEHCKTMFVPDRLKGNEEVRKAAIRLYAMLSGYLSTAGMSDFVKDPTNPAKLNDAMRQGITVTSPKRAAPASHKPGAKR